MWFILWRLGLGVTLDRVDRAFIFDLGELVV
jgi:hypothetical protein